MVVFFKFNHEFQLTILHLACKVSTSNYEFDVTLYLNNCNKT